LVAADTVRVTGGAPLAVFGADAHVRALSRLEHGGASATRIRGDLGWTPQRPNLDTIVADGWRWHSLHPYGFGVGVV
jgi:hypothetical protein